MYYGLWENDSKFSGIHIFSDGSVIYTGYWGEDTWNIKKKQTMY